MLTAGARLEVGEGRSTGRPGRVGCFEFDSCEASVGFDHVIRIWKKKRDVCVVKKTRFRTFSPQIAHANSSEIGVN